MGLVGRGIGGGTGVGGWVVSVCLCSVAFFGWRVGGLEGGTCCVCCLFGVHVVVAWSMIVVTVWCLMFECGVVDASV